MKNRNLQPWSIVSDEELAWLRRIASLALKLRRGCNCDYDYRCGNCEDICTIYNLADCKPV